jgi:FdhD protein
VYGGNASGIMAAVSAPSSLAVDLATQSGLTLVAFLRGDSMNVYSRADPTKNNALSASCWCATVLLVAQ